jgi:hypothetical protein
MAKKDIIGGVTLAELARVMFDFLNGLRAEYGDDHKLTPSEVLGCLADMFADMEEKADDIIYQRVFGAVSGILDMVAGLLDSGEKPGP